MRSHILTIIRKLSMSMTILSLKTSINLDNFYINN